MNRYNDALPLQHSQQLPALDGVRLVEAGKGRVSPLVQEGTVGRVVLRELQQVAPDERPCVCVCVCVCMCVCACVCVRVHVL